MATMNVSITDKMRTWVDARVADGTYATASDAVRDLLRERMEYEEKLAWLREEIRKGDESGSAEPFNFGEFIEETRAKYEKRKSVA